MMEFGVDFEGSVRAGDLTREDSGTPVILFHETLFQSIVSDSFSIGSAVGGVAFNYFFLGNSALLNLFLLALVVILLFSRAKSPTVYRTTTKRLRETLDKIDREHADRSV